MLILALIFSDRIGSNPIGLEPSYEFDLNHWVGLCYLPTPSGCLQNGGLRDNVLYNFVRGFSWPFNLIISYVDTCFRPTKKLNKWVIRKIKHR